MKRFKDLFEGSGSPAGDFEREKDDEKEVKGYKPRSKGEEDFANAHTVDVKAHPVATDAQHKGHDKKGNPDHHVGGKKHAGGETSPVKQGTSDVEPKGSAFRSMKQYNRPGDTAPVTQGSSKIKEEVELEEGVMDTLKKIKSSNQAMPVTFKNGKTLKVDKTTAGALIAAHGALKPANAKKFSDNLEKGESTFMSMVDFAMQNV
jgi:hypothetical protein